MGLTGTAVGHRNTEIHHLETRTIDESSSLGAKYKGEEAAATTCKCSPLFGFRRSLQTLTDHAWSATNCSEE